MARKPKASLRQGSLVLYKHQAARVASVGRKRLQIEMAEGETLRVRPKDVTLLHPGPLQGEPRGVRRGHGLLHHAGFPEHRRMPRTRI